MAANEVLFRYANEAAYKTDKTLVTVDGLVCECSLLECEEAIAVPSDLYRSVRRDPMQFFVKNGHANEKIERIVDEHDGFHVVEKIGPGRPVAARLTPKSLD